MPINPVEKRYVTMFYEQNVISANVVNGFVQVKLVPAMRSQSSSVNWAEQALYCHAPLFSAGVAFQNDPRVLAQRALPTLAGHQDGPVEATQRRHRRRRALMFGALRERPLCRCPFAEGCVPGRHDLPRDARRLDGQRRVPTGSRSGIVDKHHSAAHKEPVRPGRRA